MLKKSILTLAVLAVCACNGSHDEARKEVRPNTVKPVTSNEVKGEEGQDLPFLNGLKDAQQLRETYPNGVESIPADENKGAVRENHQSATDKKCNEVARYIPDLINQSYQHGLNYIYIEGSHLEFIEGKEEDWPSLRISSLPFSFFKYPYRCKPKVLQALNELKSKGIEFKDFVSLFNVRIKPENTPELSSRSSWLDFEKDNVKYIKLQPSIKFDSTTAEKAYRQSREEIEKHIDQVCMTEWQRLPAAIEKTASQGKNFLRIFLSNIPPSEAGQTLSEFLSKEPVDAGIYSDEVCFTFSDNQRIKWLTQLQEKGYEVTISEPKKEKYINIDWNPKS